MRTTLIVLSVGIAMLSGAGGSRADTGVPVEARKAADAQKHANAAAQDQPHGPILLTETQMAEITAGHLTAPGLAYRHRGYYVAGTKLVNDREIKIIRYGWHVGGGD
jgi:hypothetical protein